MLAPLVAAALLPAKRFAVVLSWTTVNGQVPYWTSPGDDRYFAMAFRNDTI